MFNFCIMLALYDKIVKKPFYMPSETSLSRFMEEYFSIGGAIWQIFCSSFGFLIIAARTAEYFIPDIGNAYQFLWVDWAGFLPFCELLLIEAGIGTLSAGRSHYSGSCDG